MCFGLVSLLICACGVPLQGEYFEAVCKAVDPVKKELVACFPKDAGLDEACFKISYDVLIVGVGSVNNTFGIQVRRSLCMGYCPTISCVAP
jgi:NADH dehydrogenase FAD-containing subunit